ncbi:MAG TPA: RNA 2',3'-cyclic phosphodiesterase [Thermoanaerobaculia bacterium]
MSEPDSVRAFFAIPSSLAWVESARELVDRLRRSLPQASWTKPASWHLTLLFLGDVPREAARRFAEEVGPLARSSPQGQISSAGAVVFPPHGPARVLAAGFAPSPSVEELVRLADEAHRAASRSVPGSHFADHKPFHPHVTFARVRRPWRPADVDSFRRELADWRFPLWPVNRCVLYESRLERDGAVHTPMGEWPLASGAPEARA